MHEDKFRAFMAWAGFPREASTTSSGVGERVDLTETRPPFAVQLVRQVNYGPLESKRYFILDGGNDGGFVEDDLIQANFQKLNS